MVDRRAGRGRPHRRRRRPASWSWPASAIPATPARSCARPRRPGPRGSCSAPTPVDPFGPKVVRASAGSVFRVPIAEVAGGDATLAALVPCAPAGGACWARSRRGGPPPDARRPHPGRRPRARQRGPRPARRGGGHRRRDAHHPDGRGPSSPSTSAVAGRGRAVRGRPPARRVGVVTGPQQIGRSARRAGRLVPDDRRPRPASTDRGPRTASRRAADARRAAAPSRPSCSARRAS